MLVTGLEELPDFSEKVKVYPLPAKDFFLLETQVFNSKAYEVELFDVRTGAAMTISYEKQLNKLKVSTSKLVSGLYLIVLKNDDLFVKKKVLVLR